ncbi:LysR family transcriptional regulator, partial [Pantoea dispersa]|nr:LysR family transcriptional regulator [Pantoea dispersa]
EGLTRRVRYVTPHFSVLPLMLQRLPLLATVPRGLVKAWQQRYALSTAALPIGMPDYALSLLLHNARAEDPAHSWLR